MSLLTWQITRWSWSIVFLFSKKQENMSKKYPSMVYQNPELEDLKKQSSKGTRTSQHIIARVLNKLNVMKEFSDYQVAAALMDLPSEITSDKFSYVSPIACMAYQTIQKMNTDSEDAMDQMIDEIMERQEQQDYL